MVEKNVYSRIVQKHDIEANWKKAVNFIPKIAELIVYDIDENYNYERFKIGDGKTLVNDLPFADEHIIDTLSFKENIKLAEVTTIDDPYGMGGSIGDNYVSSASASFIINVQGHIVFSGYSAASGSITIYIDGVEVPRLNYESQEYSFDGIVNENITINCSFETFTFTDFYKCTSVKNSILNLTNQMHDVIADNDELAASIESKIEEVNNEFESKLGDKADKKYASYSDEFTDISLSDLAIDITGSASINDNCISLYENDSVYIPHCGYTELEILCENAYNDLSVIINNIDLCTFNHNEHLNSHIISYTGYVSDGIYINNPTPSANLIFRVFKGTEHTDGLLRGADKAKLDSINIDSYSLGEYEERIPLNGIVDVEPIGTLYDLNSNVTISDTGLSCIEEQALRYIINVSGVDIHFVLKSAHCMVPTEINNTSVSVDGVNLDHQPHADDEYGYTFIYNGKISKNIVITTEYTNLTFEEFSGRRYKYQKGLMSAEQAKKLDDFYIDENNNTGFGNIDTLDFNASGGFSSGANNINGSKAFNILAMDSTNHTFTLDSIEGLEVGDVFSVDINTLYNNIGIITEILDDNTIVTSAIDYDVSDIAQVTGLTFDKIWDETLNMPEEGKVTPDNILFIISKPHCGTKNYSNIAHSEGYKTKAIGSYSHAEGYDTTAGYLSHSEGLYTVALNESHAEGWKSEALGENSHAEGSETKSLGQASHAEGVKTTASGIASHTEGYRTKAEGTYAHAEGVGHSNGYVIASGTASHAEGRNTQASGEYSHSEGSSTVASGEASHAEGTSTKATGVNSHAEGTNTLASGKNSHVEGGGEGGTWSYATGAFSHAEGKCVNASSEAQHVQGRYNIADSNNKYAHIVGNGTDKNNRSNAHTLDWEGNAWYSGNINIDGVYLDNSGETIPGQKISNLTNLSEFTSGKIDVNYLIDGAAFSPDTIYNKKTTGKYFCYLDVDNSSRTLSDGIYLLAYDMEILSSPNPESIGISGQNTDLSNKRVGGKNYANSKFTTEKYNHVYYPFIVDNATYKKYGIYCTDKSANGITNECSYKIHNIGLYKLNELTTEINSFKTGIDDNGNIITTLNDYTKNNILLDIDITPDMVIYNDGTKNLIALMGDEYADSINIYSTSTRELNIIEKIENVEEINNKVENISTDFTEKINKITKSIDNKLDKYYEKDISLIGITTPLTEENPSISDKGVSSSYNDFTINISGFIKLEGYAWTESGSASIYIDGQYLQSVDAPMDEWGNFSEEFTFEGYVNKEITISCLFGGVEFNKFVKLTPIEEAFGTKELASYSEPTQTSLLDLNIELNVSEYGYGSNITENGIVIIDDSEQGSATLYINEYVEFEAECYAGYPSPTILINGINLCEHIHDWDTPSHIITYKGYVDKNGIFFAPNSPNAVLTFNYFKVKKTTNGLMSGADKEKLDNTYSKEEVEEKLQDKADNILASYSENITSLSLLDLQINNNENTQISNNKITISGGDSVFINYIGYLEFEATCYGEHVIPSLIINDEDLCDSNHIADWDGSSSHNIKFAGYINNGITYSSNSGWASITFNSLIKKDKISINGLISGTDKEKLDNTYSKEEVDSAIKSAILDSWEEAI